MEPLKQILIFNLDFISQLTKYNKKSYKIPALDSTDYYQVKNKIILSGG